MKKTQEEREGDHYYNRLMRQSDYRNKQSSKYNEFLYEITLKKIRECSSMYRELMKESGNEFKETYYATAADNQLSAMWALYGDLCTDMDYYEKLESQYLKIHKYFLDIAYSSGGERITFPEYR